MFDTGEEHGRIVTGEGKGKKHGPGSLLHGPHATEILVISSVAGVLLMYLTFRKGAGANGPAAGTAGSPAISPAGVSAGDVAGFDQAAVQGLSQRLDMQSQLLQTLTNGATALPQDVQGLSAQVPLASKLFAPTDSSTFVHYANGTVAQVQSDGSQLGLSWGQWQPLSAAGARPSVEMPGSASGSFFTTVGNLANVKPGGSS